MKYNQLLSDYCRWNDNRSLLKLLKKHSDLDITIEEGICFSFAIKHKNVDMLNTLLDYYEKTKLQGDHDSMEYKIAHYKLRQILQEAINSFDVSSKIQESLNSYIITTEDSDDEQYLTDFNEDGFIDTYVDLPIIGGVSDSGTF